MTIELWYLAIEMPGNQAMIAGQEDVLRMAVDAWRRWVMENVADSEGEEWKDGGNGEPGRKTEPIYTIQGVCDSYDRAERQLTIRFDAVTNMTLFRKQ